MGGGDPIGENGYGNLRRSASYESVEEEEIWGMLVVLEYRMSVGPSSGFVVAEMGD